MKTISFLLMVVTPFFLFAQVNESLLTAGNEDYQKGSYTTAIDKYQQLIDGGFSSTALHYNLGNSFYKTKALGYAILHYEKGLLQNPNDADILFNLEKANRQQKDEIIEIPEFFLKRWWVGLRKFLGSGIWTTFGLLLLWGGIAGFCYWLIGKDRDKRKRAFLAGIGISLLSFVFILLGRSSYLQQTQNDYAVIVSKKTAFNISPDVDSEVKFDIHEGLKVEILDQIGETKKIKLPNGDIGWVIINSLEKI